MPSVLFLQHAENEGLPETFCSYHKVFIGAAEKGLMPKPRFIINTTLACDANLLTFRRLADFFGVKQYVIDVPYGQDEEAVQYVAEQLRGMKAFIEAETGEKIDEGKLAKAVGRSQRSMDNFRRFCHWGCKHTLGGARLAKQALEEAGLPTLLLDGDSCDRGFGGEGQAATRMEAFLEVLEGMA